MLWFYALPVWAVELVATACAVGLCAMIGFAYLFGTENRRMQLLMTAIVAALLTAILVLIAEFDRPFSGSISVSDRIWRTFIDLRIPEIR